MCTCDEIHTTFGYCSDCRSFYLADRHSLVSLRAFLCEQCELELEKSKGLYVYDFFQLVTLPFKQIRP